MEITLGHKYRWHATTKGNLNDPQFTPNLRQPTIQITFIDVYYTQNTLCGIRNLKVNLEVFNG